MRRLSIALVAVGLATVVAAGPVTAEATSAPVAQPTTTVPLTTAAPPVAPTSDSALPSKPVIGIRLVDAPVSGKDDPRAHSYIIDHLAPGTVIHRRIEVVNSTPTTASVSLYDTGATIADGTFVGGPQGQVDELTRWISLSQSTLTLPTRTSVQPIVTIAVPRTAAPGERYGVVWAQVSSRSAPGVDQVNRVGIRIYLSVGPGNPPATDFVVEQLVAGRRTSGEPTLSATVRNTGGGAIDLSGVVTLTNGPGGLSGGPFKVVLGSTLAPGQTEPVDVALDPRLPDGPWDARISLTSDEVTREATATITFPNRGTAAPVAATTVPPAAPPGSTGVSWWVVIVVAAGGLLVALAVVLVARSRRTAVLARR